MTPDEVPGELVEIARRAYAAAPQKRDGQPTRMRHALAAVLSAAGGPAAVHAPAETQRAWPAVTLTPNTPMAGRHKIEVDGRDIGAACRRARLLLEPGCWPRLDLELKLVETGGVNADGVEIVLPPETRLALEALGWTPPPAPVRPGEAGG